MGIFDRIILTIYSLSLTVLSTVFVGVAAGWTLPQDFIQKTLQTVNGRWTVGMTSAVFTVVSLRFIWYVFTPRFPRRAIVHEAEFGDVYVSLDAVENLVKKVARQVRGVRDVKAKVDNTQAGLVVSLRAVVAPDTSIPETSSELQNTLKRYVKDVVGVNIAQTRVVIVNIASEARRGRTE